MCFLALNVTPNLLVFCIIWLYKANDPQMKPIRANQSQFQPPPLLTVKQVAEILQWNMYTVIKKCVKGELPAFKLGRAWRFRQDEIVAWIESKRNA